MYKQGGHPGYLLALQVVSSKNRLHVYSVEAKAVLFASAFSYNGSWSQRKTLQKEKYFRIGDESQKSVKSYIAFIYLTDTTIVLAGTLCCSMLLFVCLLSVAIFCYCFVFGSIALSF